jgi:hypothetical protein
MLLLFQIKGSAQNIHIYTRLENIKIGRDTSFTRDVSVLLKKSNDEIMYPVLYDSELEDLSNIKVYIKKGNQFKLEKESIINEDVVDLDYITSKKLKTITIPPEVEAKITYTIKCKELMYFSDLPFFSYDEIDTLKYQITIPETFRFLHTTIYRDSLNYLFIDSLKSDSLMKWRIEAVPVKVKPDPLMFFGIYKSLKVPLMKTIVVPLTYAHKEKEYLNDWYLHKLETRRGLDSTTRQKIDELTMGISDPMKILDTLYNYVKTKFKYVAIEVGMGAFIPTHANEVFINKQGDCKDLSNFLSEALNYKGIKSYVALAATFNHLCDCDFPSLCSANHVICVAYVNGNPIILDPTDPIHLPQTPVQSILERSILIINPYGGEFYKINGFTPQQNMIDYEIELNVDSDQSSMHGEFSAHYEGISGNFLRSSFLNLSNNEINNIGKKHYELVFGNQSISDLHIVIDKNSIEVEGKLSVKGKIFDDKDSRFLFLDFLPRIIESENRETLLEGTYLGSTIGKKVKLRITLDKAFKAFDPIEHSISKNGVSLNLKVSNPSEFIIACEYEFIFDYFIIEKGNLDITNEILKSFKKITNEPIVLKN